MRWGVTSSGMALASLFLSVTAQALGPVGIQDSPQKIGSGAILRSRFAFVGCGLIFEDGRNHYV